RAQQARNWKVEAKVSPWTPDGVSIDLSVRDAGGRPITDTEFTVILAHPAKRREDQGVALDRIGAGTYRGRAEVAPGQRDLVVEGAKDDERIFRSKSRIHIRSARTRCLDGRHSRFFQPRDDGCQRDLRNESRGRGRPL